MYEYTPRHEKRCERGLAALSLIGGAVCMILSNLHLVSDTESFLFSIASLLFDVPGFVVLLRFLTHCYSCCVAPREDGILGYDLTVTDSVGKRQKVVCRISVSDVIKIERVTKENRREVFGRAKGRRIYRYTDCMGYEDTYLLSAVDAGEEICIYLHADERLISLLK